jgi:hypothetical protein
LGSRGAAQQVELAEPSPPVGAVGGCGPVTLGDPFAEAGQPYAAYSKWHVGEGAGRGRPITARPGAARPHIDGAPWPTTSPPNRRSDGIDQLDWLTGATDTSNRDGYLCPALRPSTPPVRRTTSRFQNPMCHT